MAQPSQRDILDRGLAENHDSAGQEEQSNEHAFGELCLPQAGYGESENNAPQATNAMITVRDTVGCTYQDGGDCERRR